MQNNESKSLKASFVESMKEKILSGELRPGDRLPPERELALEAGISRGSVNQALLDLERMGFLHIVPRKGTFVSEYVKNATPETLAAIMSYDSELIDRALFTDLMQLRTLVERECARLACANLTEESLDRLVRSVDAIYSASEDEVAETVYEFHKCIIEISGNMAYAMVFLSFGKMILTLIRTHYSSHAELESSLPRYAMLAEAIGRRDAYEADRCMQNILGQATDYINLYLKNKETGRTGETA